MKATSGHRWGAGPWEISRPPGGDTALPDTWAPKMSLPAGGFRPSIQAMVTFDPCLAATGVVWAPGAPDTRNPDGSTTAPSADTRAARMSVAASQTTKNRLPFHAPAGEPCSPSPTGHHDPTGIGQPPGIGHPGGPHVGVAGAQVLPGHEEPPWAGGHGRFRLGTRRPGHQQAHRVLHHARRRHPGGPDVRGGPPQVLPGHQETRTIPRHRRIAPRLIRDRDQLRFELAAGRRRDPDGEGMLGAVVYVNELPHREELRAVAGQRQIARCLPPGVRDRSGRSRRPVDGSTKAPRRKLAPT